MNESGLVHALSQRTSAIDDALSLAILSRQSGGLLVLDRNLKVVFIDSRVCEFTRLDARQARGVSLYALYPALVGSELGTALHDLIASEESTVWRDDREPHLKLAAASIFGKGSNRELDQVVIKVFRARDRGPYCLLQFDLLPPTAAVVASLDEERSKPQAGGRGAPDLRGSDQAVLVTDLHGFIKFANPPASAMFGYETDDLAGASLRTLVPSLDDIEGEDVEERLTELVASDSLGLVEGITDSGESIRMRLLVFPLAARAKELMLVVDDLTGLWNEWNRLGYYHQLFDLVAESTADGLVLLDKDGFVTRANPVCLELLGLTQLASNTHLNEFMQVIDEHGKPRAHPAQETLLDGRNVQATVTLHVASSGEHLPVMISAQAVRDKNNVINSCLLIFRSVSEARRISTRLTWQSLHDTLTGLPNRRQLSTEIQKAIDSAQKQNLSHVLLYIDIYNFGVINNASGHAAGDELLRQFSRLLVNQVGDTGLVARVGNDEFAILLRNTTELAAYDIAEEIIWHIKEFTLPWGDQKLKVGASIGAEVIDSATVSDIDVMVSAGASCSQAKEMGRNRIHFQDHGSQEENRQHLATWVGKINEAVEDDRFRLFAQPIVPTDDRFAQPVRHEILVRMLDKAGNIIPPINFIPAAEQYFLIDEIDKLVFKKSLLALQADPLGRYLKGVSINLSGSTISDTNLYGYIVEQFNNTGVDPRRVQFEITETAAISHFDHAKRLILELQKVGCSFALDDFGSGLSSFAYLKELPVSCLKIDGMFVQNMERSEVDWSMISTINHLGHVMGIHTVAECVETEGQLLQLQDIGVDLVQGYFVERPLPLQQVLEG